MNLRKQIDIMNRDPEFKQVLKKDKTPLEFKIPKSVQVVKNQLAYCLAAQEAFQHRQHIKTDLNHKATDECGCQFDLEKFKLECPWTLEMIKSMIQKQERLFNNTMIMEALPDKGAKVKQRIEWLKSLQEFLQKHVFTEASTTSTLTSTSEQT